MKREDFCFRNFIFSFMSHRKHRTIKWGRGNTKEKFPSDAHLKILQLPENTRTPWVVLVINANISLVGLMF